LADLHGTFRMFSEHLVDHILFGNLMFPKRSQNIPAGVKGVDGHDVEFF